ncbi:hypothetical protein BH10BAC4_BH10BAC4_11770 [soil metagenome]
MNKSNITLIVFVVLAAAALYTTYDVLFSSPDHMEGVIIEKIFVEPHSTTAATPYGGALRSNYFITSEKEEQWIAIVKMDNGDTLKVHCKAEHYATKNVGDMVHFKKYEGKHFHIKYFAHNEEED